MTKMGVGNTKSLGLIPGRVKRLSFFPKRADRLCGPQSLLSGAYRGGGGGGLFPRGNATGTPPCLQGQLRFTLTHWYLLGGWVNKFTMLEWRYKYVDPKVSDGGPFGLCFGNCP